MRDVTASGHDSTPTGGPDRPDSTNRRRFSLLRRRDGRRDDRGEGPDPDPTLIAQAPLRPEGSDDIPVRPDTDGPDTDDDRLSSARTACFDVRAFAELLRMGNPVSSAPGLVVRLVGVELTLADEATRSSDETRRRLLDDLVSIIVSVRATFETALQLVSDLQPNSSLIRAIGNILVLRADELRTALSEYDAVLASDAGSGRTPLSEAG